MSLQRVPLRISVVIPSFNQAGYLRLALESVLGQVGEFDLEVLVIDGASTDGTIDVLRSYGNRVRWVCERDDGQSDALNKGFGLATGDVVGWLNSDDLYQPGALSAVARAFRDNPRLEWVHGRTDVIDASGRVCRRWVSAYKRWRCRAYSYRRLLTENFIQPNTVFWRRELMARVGGVDRGLHLAMDYDLWIRFARSSPPEYLDAPIACFRWYATSKSGSRYVEAFREARAIARRYEPGWRWPHWYGALKAALAIGCYKAADLLGGVTRAPAPVP
jgi:glycosyltransferase involved in cell wall biosynthesis